MFKTNKSRDPRSPSRSQRDVDAAEYHASRYDAMRGYDQVSHANGSYEDSMPGSFDYSPNTAQRTLYQELKDSQAHAQPPVTPRQSGGSNAAVPTRPIQLPPTPPTVSRPKSLATRVSTDVPPVDLSQPVPDLSGDLHGGSDMHTTIPTTTSSYSARTRPEATVTAPPPESVKPDTVPPANTVGSKARSTTATKTTASAVSPRGEKDEPLSTTKRPSAAALPRARVLEPSVQTGNEGAEWEEILGRLTFRDEKENQFLDLVDEMRRHGLDREIALPRLVVCGKQSSGKSSVLEAITRLPFPRGDTTCTRFVTEIRMIRDSKLTQTNIAVTIQPGEDRDDADRRILKSFQETCSPSGFVDLFPKATSAMGLTNGASGTRSKFSKDTLCVEIRGPYCQRISLIDLPGLVNANQGEANDVAVVESITDKYIKEERTIILAVVNAEGNINDHGILEKARLVDPKGDRTFGIITKPDKLEAGLTNETEWLNLALQNEESFVKFNKGCHVMVNRDGHDTYKGTSSDARDQHEENFFCAEKWGPGSLKNEGKDNRWRELYNTTHWGVKHLRPRLTQLLFRHTKAQIPSLREDINGRIAEYDADLARFDVVLMDEDALRVFLSERFQKMSHTIIDGVNGTNRDEDFFGVEQFESTNGAARYLRGRIREESAAFNRTLLAKGHRTEYVWGPDEPTPAELPELDKFHTFLVKTVGTELPGNFDPHRITPLFNYYSKPWHHLAQQFLNRAYRHCRNFVRIVVDEGLGRELPDIATKFSRNVLEGKFDDLKKNADAQLLAIERDRKGTVITEDIRFQAEASDRLSVRQSRRLKLVSSMENLEGTKSNIVLATDPDSKRKEAAIAMIDEMLIYYRIARARYIDNIITQVVERCLLSTLSECFSPAWLHEPAVFKLVTDDPNTEDRRREKETVDERRKNLKDCLVRLEMLDV